KINRKRRLKIMFGFIGMLIVGGLIGWAARAIYFALF
ncbi:hypothetical protein V376_00356, partial [Staphylococcus aureus S29036]